MTSREALENIKNRNIHLNYLKLLDGRNYIKELEIIEKDLEILEILKKYIVYVPSQISGAGIHIAIPETKDIGNKIDVNKDCFIVKEWLDGKD